MAMCIFLPFGQTKYERLFSILVFVFQLFITYMITARKRSLGQGNIFSSVCQQICPRYLSSWAGTPPSSRQVHPQAGTPPQPGTPQEQCMLGDTGNKRAVRILLECILVSGKVLVRPSTVRVSSLNPPPPTHTHTHTHTHKPIRI